MNPRGAAPTLEVRGLTKVFRRRGKPPLTAVDKLDLVLRRGEVVGLLGPNGAGKTTIIKCALGLVHPTSGEIFLSGWSVRRNYLRAIENAAAVLEGARNVYWRLSPRENVRFFVGLQGIEPKARKSRIEELLKLFRLDAVADEPVMNLSTGMKQKVAVVSALARETPLVFLDEPTLGLDVETSLELRSILRDMAGESGQTLVVSSHDMDVIQDVCQRVVILKEGRVVADETVGRLLDLFRTRAYRMVLAGGTKGGGTESLEERLARTGRLGRVVSDLEVTRRGDETELTFSLPSASGLYDVVDLVRNEGAVIEAITQSEPDLEEAFLRIVRPENGGGGR